MLQLRYGLPPFIFYLGYVRRAVAVICLQDLIINSLICQSTWYNTCLKKLSLLLYCDDKYITVF